MKKLMFVISALFVLGFFVEARAELSSQAYTGKRYEEQQVIVMAYNNSGASISENSIVVIDTTATAGSTLGTYITTSTTADDYKVFGVSNEAIAAGAVGAICVRGPHKVYYTSAAPGAGVIAATSTTTGAATTYTTSDATLGGQLGITIGNATSGENTHLPWVWVNPQIHK